MAGVRKRTTPPEPLPLAFRLDGVEFTVVERPTRWWLRTLAAEPPGCWWHVVPVSLAGDGARVVMERLMDQEDPLDLDDVERVAEGVVSAVLGMDMWAGHRLARVAYSNWVLFDGWCATKGSFDPLTQPVGRVLAAVYAWRLSMCEKKPEVTRLESEVWGPPPLRTAAGRLRDQAPRHWDDSTEEAAFMAALESRK